MRTTIEFEQLCIVQQATVAQLQTASDVVDALNLGIQRDALASNTAFRLEFVISHDAVPRLKDYADSLKIL